MEMLKFEDMKLKVTGEPEQDAALLEWLYLMILVPLSFNSPPMIIPRGFCHQAPKSKERKL